MLFKIELVVVIIPTATVDILIFQCIEIQLVGGLTKKLNNLVIILTL